MSTFWVLSPGSDAKLAEWSSEVEVEEVRCPVSPGHQRAGKRTTDLSVVLPSSAVQDFVWTWNADLLVRREVVSVFEAEGVTGFSTHPAMARFARGPGAAPAPILSEFVVTGWGGVASPLSGISLDGKLSCPACGLLVYTGLTNPANLIDERQWDGSDVFIAWPLPKFIIVTDRVADVIKRHELTGAQLEKLEAIRVSAPTLSPGRLSYRMPEPRAHQLGDRLGIA